MYGDFEGIMGSLLGISRGLLRGMNDKLRHLLFNDMPCTSQQVLTEKMHRIEGGFSKSRWI